MFNTVSLLKNLLTQSKFDQSQNPQLLISALKKNNLYIEEYSAYCNLLDEERARFLEEINNTQIK